MPGVVLDRRRLASGCRLQSDARVVLQLEPYAPLRIAGPRLAPRGLGRVADAELFRLEAIIRWLDAADVRLKSG